MDKIVFAVLLGVIPAINANIKGRSFILWWLYGTLAFIIALIHSFVLKDMSVKNENPNDKVECGLCGEEINRNTIKCIHCGADFPVKSKNPLVPEDLIIKKQDGHMINESGVRAFIYHLAVHYGDIANLQSLANNEIIEMKNLLPDEVHESYRRKVEQVISELY
ncbi:hypothetical protein M2263_000912 [Providencia alcalifaciens]|nr:hypothetical protein [Providencia alcalifaciens]